MTDQTHGTKPETPRKGDPAHPKGPPPSKPGQPKPGQAKPGQAKSRQPAPAVEEIGGRDGPDPTRFGDYEKDGRCVDF